MARALIKPHIQRFVFAAIGTLLALLALMTLVLDVAEPASYVGGLLVWAAILEIVHTYRRAENPARRSGWLSGAITLVIGILLINANLFQLEALIDFIILLFAIDTSRYLFTFYKSWRRENPSWGDLGASVANALVLLIVLVNKGRGAEWVFAIAGSLRIFGTIYALFTARIGVADTVGVDIIDSLGLKGNKELETLVAKLKEEDERRAPIDAGWILTLLLILFFIHLARMGPDKSRIAVLSPLVGVIGDMFVALVFAFGFIGPIRVIFRKLTGLMVSTLWRWVHKVPAAKRKWFSLRTLAMAWLIREIRVTISLRKSGYSLLNAFRNGLRIGLPFAALLAAVMPMLGMSWYFDTENWASGIWDGYAGARTEVWRDAMIDASGEKIGPGAFRLRPSGVTDKADFSFVVVGDPGEGDPSQHVLKDQILAVSNKPDVKFVVISSDIVYPSGAMRDYERKFFLPFKGITKPVYAIPGNHDWYDALDGFAATFYTPSAARLAIESRIRSDLKLSPTTTGDIERMIGQASFLRKEYRLSTGHQNAPFFQISNDYFVLLTIDTGVLRRLDNKQLAWAKSVLEASKGKYVMALLGHPFFAIGEYQGNMNPDFHAIHELLRSYNVPLVMAGDTHDLEYYKELPQSEGGRNMHHFVNGGGGAYLSVGAAMATEGSRPTEDWAIYPPREPLMNKIDSLTPRWKYPAWLWLKKYNGYPFSAEWLSAAFDYNQAPYFQSFMEIKVEKSRNRVRLIPYGIHGQLRWSDLEHGGKAKPASAGENDFVQWTFSMVNN